MTRLELRGLAADNLLAVLALLGLQRALDAAEPDWHARVSWDGPPWRPWLVVDGQLGEEEVAAAADAGVAAIGHAFDFRGRKNLDFDRNGFRLLSGEAVASASPSERDAVDLLAALASDGALRPREDKVQPTPLCVIFGQGHQNFLERLELVTRGTPAGAETTRQIREALFDVWRYAESGPTFRWDPEEDRRYALGFGDPSSAKIRTVPGANRLAALGVTAFVSAPALHGLRTAAARGRGRSVQIAWPIWTVPLRWPEVGYLLRHPELAADAPPPEKLEPLGVAEVMRARRISVGKYFSFEPARPILGREPD
jgi:hypothetical protein